MGGSKAPSGTVKQATLPTAADYAANKMAMPAMGSERMAKQNYAAKLMQENQLFGEPEKEKTRELLAGLAQNALSGVSDAFSRAITSQKQASGAAQWANMQRQSRGNGAGFDFQPDDPYGYQIQDDNRTAVGSAWAKAATDIIGGALQGGLTRFK
jgi:hypothetical protein